MNNRYLAFRFLSLHLLAAVTSFLSAAIAQSQPGVEYNSPDAPNEIRALSSAVTDGSILAMHRLGMILTSNSIAQEHGVLLNELAGTSLILRAASEGHKPAIAFMKESLFDDERANPVRAIAISKWREENNDFLGILHSDDWPPLTKEYLQKIVVASGEKFITVNESLSIGHWLYTTPQDKLLAFAKEGLVTRECVDLMQKAAELDAMIRNLAK